RTAVGLLLRLTSKTSVKVPTRSCPRRSGNARPPSVNDRERAVNGARRARPPGASASGPNLWGRNSGGGPACEQVPSERTQRLRTDPALANGPSACEQTQRLRADQQAPAPARST